MRNENDDDLSPIEALERAERVASAHSDRTTCSSLNISYGELRPILAAARKSLMEEGVARTLQDMSA